MMPGAAGTPPPATRPSPSALGIISVSISSIIIIISSLFGFGLAGGCLLPRPVAWRCSRFLPAWGAAVVWCASGLGLPGLKCGVLRGMRLLGRVGVMIMTNIIMILVIIIIIIILSWVNCHRNRACQECDPRDS